jgi:hypothetical protein
MEHIRVEVVVFALSLLAVLTMRGFADRIREALENFRGGPPTTPMHPSPSNDALLLTRRLKRRSEL